MASVSEGLDYFETIIDSEQLVKCCAGTINRRHLANKRNMGM